MQFHLEESLKRDIDLIRSKLAEMGGCCERALRDAVQAFLQRDRQRAYTVIIRDHRIDALEKEIDRLCLEFLVRQQPAGTPLRFAYCTIKVNAELERVGDYAESVAHQAAKLSSIAFTVPPERFIQIADLAVRMLQDSVRAFLEENEALARATIDTEDTVDVLKTRLRTDLVQWYKEGRLPFEALDPCLLITRRLERISDQARDICLETLYLSTGEYAKHVGNEVFRVLFVDRYNAGASPIAEAIGESLGQSRFVFASAGLEPKPWADATLKFMREKGFDLTRKAPKSLTQVPNLDHYHVIVSLDGEVKRQLPRPAHKVIYLDWSLSDPAATTGSSEEVQRVHEAAFRFLDQHVRALVAAVLDEGSTPPSTLSESPL